MRFKLHKTIEGGTVLREVETMTNNVMQATEVQAILDSLLPEQPFQVSFLTNKGETRVYTGKLLASGNASDSIAFETSNGIKRFNVHNVIEIKGV